MRFGSVSYFWFLLGLRLWLSWRWFHREEKIRAGWRRERAVRPREGIPKGGTHVLVACTTPGQLDYFVAMALQQHGEQAALRKGRS